MRKIFGIIVLTVLLVNPASHAAKQTFDELCHDILESLQSYYPVKSTQMGIHAYDFLLTDYSSGAVKKAIKTFKDYEQKLYKYRNADLSTHQRVNYQLMKSNVDIALLDLERIKWHKVSPQTYVDEVVDGIYSLMISQHAPLHEKRPAIIARMKAVPGLLATARKNLKNVPPVYIEAALESLESGSLFYQEVAGALMNAFPEKADEILRISTQAREAMNDFSAWLSAMTPGEATAFAIGKKNFDYKLNHEYFLEFDSDSLLRIGEALLEATNRAYDEYAAYIEEHHQNGQDSVFVPASFTASDVLDYYKWETAQLRIFVEGNDYITVPPDIAPVEVIETPSFLRTMISGIAYQPAGPFDSLQTGYFYVRPIPPDMEQPALDARFRYIHRRGFRGSVVHEAYPGHHLQLQLAGMNPDPVRKWQRNLMLVEGWALYCEEEIYHRGLYGDEDPVQWLNVLGGIQFRAARIIADVKLHTGQFTVDECVQWMNEALGVSTDSFREFIRKEVRRYTFTPTIQMSYLLGKTEIMKIREAAQTRDGADFSLKNFHDALLAEGSIPPALLRTAMNLTP